MRNTDTNTECEGAALALPAAHQTAGRTITLDSADIAVITAGLLDELARVNQGAKMADRAEMTTDADEYRRRAAHIHRLLRRL
ncbi:MAG: hypothetical protein KBH81_14740 [Phycisphaerae bacterium]|nr:hypothetical protein [Phycisphaerae bacterium]